MKQIRLILATAVALLCLAPNSHAIPDELLRGSALKAEQIAELEEKVAKDPEDMSSRMKLLGNYFTGQRGSGDKKEARQKHILWIIENHPEAEVAGLPYAHLDPHRDGDVYKEGKRLWLEQVKKHPKDTKVLGNAARFFAVFGVDESERILLELQKIDPANPRWPEDLGHLYKRKGMNPAAPLKDAADKSLKQYERSYNSATTPAKKFYVLPDLAKAAFVAGDLEKAEQYAGELLDLSRDFPTDWNYGNAIHHANLVLGRIALRRGDQQRAAEYLLQAGGTKGSPQLNSFGPNMTLAKDLLEKGEKKAVLEYFELCRKFWKMHRDRLDQWKKEVEEGKVPDFGANLVY